MPIHDWTRVEAELFHAFRHRWLGGLCDALNEERLPDDHFALVEPVRRSDRIAIRHRDGRLVAVVEVLATGEKSDAAALRGVVEAMRGAILGHVHALVVDLFPPGSHDPQGIHKAIWDTLEPDDFELPSGKPLTAASYDSGPIAISYVEPMAVGDVLPEMPIFLAPGSYVPAPLEATYQAAWDAFPAALKDRLQEGRAPSDRSDPEF